MALQQSDLSALETALATGELTVEYDGKKVTFRSVDELLKAIAYVKQQIGEASVSAPVTQSFASFYRD